MEVPNNKVGVLIGKGGETIRHLQYNSGAKIQITRDAESDPRSSTRSVELIGTLENIEKAERLIKDVIAEADAGGSPSLVAKGFNPVQSVIGDQIEMQVPNEKVGLIIGKGGETIKSLQTRSGARIQLVQLPEGEQSKERTVRVTGDRKQIERAREMIQEVMDQIWILLFTSGQHCLLRVAIDNYYSLSSTEERYQALVPTIAGCV
nr:far upstream element-binding protein 1-like isoform X2 [Ipomoea batatas]